MTKWVPVVEKEEKKTKVRSLAKLGKNIEYENENIEIIVSG